jgi:GAF domain-containing protein
VLLEINNAIISNLTRDSLFQAITKALRQVVSFDRAVLPLYDPEKDVFQTFALAGPSLPGHVHDVQTEIRRHGTGAGWVLDHRQPLLRRNLEAERELAADEMLLAGGIRSYLIVPLIARDRILGALFLGSSTPNQYSAEDVGFLEEVGQQIALAIENMLAYEEIARLRARLEEENRYLQDEIKSEHNFEEIIGQSSAITRVFTAVETVAPTDATVLIVGETGTGKELVARALHNLGPRRGQALVKVNCAALPAGLIESELFGHEKGAFTGALTRRQGRFELAHGGTLFLDEIWDLPLELQLKLLLAVFQLLTAARTFDVFHFPPSRRFWARVHRLSGYLAILLTLRIAYHCVFLLGFETTSLRVALHSILGSALYGAFLAKVIIVRQRLPRMGIGRGRGSGVRGPEWALADLGALFLQDPCDRVLSEEPPRTTRAHPCPQSAQG